MSCMTPLVFFLLPSLTTPGTFEKVPLNSLPKTKTHLETSQDDSSKRFRKAWKEDSHKSCILKYGPDHCAIKFIITIQGQFAECATSTES